MDVLTVAVSATPVSFRASSESVSAVAEAAAPVVAWTETITEQEKVRIVMNENSVINLFMLNTYNSLLY